MERNRMESKLLFSVTKADFEMQTFRCPGKGGQNVNKVSSGVRLIHPPSGARAESCATRDQPKNRQDAFTKLVETPKFKAWLKAETARRLGQPSIEERVESATKPGNLKVEVRDEEGKWVSE